jgi:hypothetical protein
MSDRAVFARGAAGGPGFLRRRHLDLPQFGNQFSENHAKKCKSRAENCHPRCMKGSISVCLTRMQPGSFSTGQVARQLGATLAAVRALCQHGLIAAETTPGGHLRVPASEVKRLKRDGLPTIPRPTQLSLLLDTLPPGQRLVAAALVDDEAGLTYREVATILGLSLGTVHQHLRRIRLRRPLVYSALMKLRARQLKARHRGALARAKAHSKRWHTLLRRRYFPTSN